MSRRGISRAKGCACAVAIACLAMLCFGPAAQANAGDPLTYFGGPVAHSMTGVLVDWGPNVNPIYKDEATGDPGLIKNFATASGGTAVLGGVLAQYMDSSGHNAANSVSYGHQYAITPSVTGTPSATGTTIQDASIQSELVSQINAGHLPTPAGNGLSSIYLLLFPSGEQICFSNGECSGQVFCAYHGSTHLADGTHVLYAVLPDNTSGLMASHCGNASTPLQNQTSYTTHEWSETITDPLVGEAGNYAPPLAWYDRVCPNNSSPCGEIGDKCNHITGVQGGWTVQLEWSNLDANCVSTEPHYSPPTASFVAPASPAPGQVVSFDGSGSTDPSQNQTSASDGASSSYSIPSGLASYDWNWGDSTIHGSGVTATHTYAQPGTYQASLTITDNLGFTSTVTKQVSVAGPSHATPAPPPVKSVAPAPSVSTGAISALTSNKATAGGKVGPNGIRTIYHFEYGRSTAYGHSSPSLTAGAGTAPVVVSASLGGLQPSSTYHYRLVASSAGGTVVGVDLRFKTHVRPPSPPRFSFSVAPGHSLRGAPTHRLVVRFNCSRGCAAQFVITAVLKGITRFTATPLALAQGSARLRAAGSGRVTLGFTTSIRKWLRTKSRVKLVVSGYATGSGGVPSAPRWTTLTLG